MKTQETENVWANGMWDVINDPSNDNAIEPFREALRPLVAEHGGSWEPDNWATFIREASPELWRLYEEHKEETE